MLENKIHYKLVIAYDGTPYEGWQVQPNQRSVANSIENIFFSIFKKHITLVGASRTDAGVHAQGQVASFSLDAFIDPARMIKALNRGLPHAIRICSIDQVPSSFHPRFDVKEKIYWYRIFTTPPLPWQSPYGLYCPNLDINKLKKAVSLFVGTHDFRSFCTGEYANTVRTIKAIEIEIDKEFNGYKIVFKARGFLKYMIRRIIGACLHVIQKDLPLSLLQEALRACNAQQHLPTAPSHGLLLYLIEY